MAIPHLKSGDIVDLLGPALADAKTTTLAKTNDLELIRMVLPTGRKIPLHKALGEITVQCLEGRVAFTAHGTTQELTAGQLLFLAAEEPHALNAIEESSVLVTILLPRATSSRNVDIVQEASEESFPASNPPARSPIVSP